MRFIRKDPFLGSFTAGPFLPPKFFDTRTLCDGSAFLRCFDFIEQQPPCDEPIEPLLPSCLTFYLQTRRTVQQHHARCRLVHVLPAMSTRAHKRFLQVRFVDAKRRHAPRQLILFFRAYCERAHEFLMQGTVADGRVSIFNSAWTLYAFCSESPQTKTGTSPSRCRFVARGSRITSARLCGIRTSRRGYSDSLHPEE